MKMTALGFLQFISLIPFLLFAGYFLAIRKEFLYGLFFLLLEALNFMLVTRNPEGKQTAVAARLALSWMIILMCVNAFFLDVPTQISVLLIPIPLGLLFLWMVLTGK